MDAISLHIWNCLHNYAYEDAIFAAERLHAEANNSESLFLLATSLYRSGRPKQVCALLCSKLSCLPRNKYLLAKSYFDIGQISDAKAVVLKGSFTNQARRELTEEFKEQVCFVFQLLGDIFRANGDKSQAIKCYESSLTCNPMMWSSFERMCKIDPNVDPRKYFRISSTISINPVIASEPPILCEDSVIKNNESNLDIRENINPEIEKAVLNVLQDVKASTPLLVNKVPKVDSFAHSFTPPISPLYACVPVFSKPRIKTVMLSSGPRHFGSYPPKVSLSNSGKKTPGGPNLRPRTRLQMHKAVISTSSSTNNALDSVTEPQTPNNNETASAVGDEEKPTTKDSACVVALNSYLSLLMQLGKAFCLLNQYHCKESANLLAKVPTKHLATMRLLTWAACCHMHVGEYGVAKRLFDQARAYEPWQLLGMDYYSTCLWHLKDEVTLASLAQELFYLDQNAPEPWCVAGNCYSLHRDSHIAIKFFQQALKVSPNNAYAATLLGHELMANHFMDAALSAFQHALSVDPRMYTALFGISNVYFSQDQFNEAEKYLVQAVRIFPRSSDLLTHLGVVRAKLGWNGTHITKRITKEELFTVDESSLCNGKKGSALHCFNLAMMLNPKCYLAKFHRACLLLSDYFFTYSVQELQELGNWNPREPTIPMLIGNAYNRIGAHSMAQTYFTKAISMDRQHSRSDTSSFVCGFQKERVGPKLLFGNIEDPDLDVSELSRSLLPQSDWSTSERPGNVLAYMQQTQPAPMTAEHAWLETSMDMSTVPVDDAVGNGSGSTRNIIGRVRTSSSSEDELELRGANFQRNVGAAASNNPNSGLARRMLRSSSTTSPTSRSGVPLSRSTSPLNSTSPAAPSRGSTIRFAVMGTMSSDLNALGTPQTTRYLRSSTSRRATRQSGNSNFMPNSIQDAMLHPSDEIDDESTILIDE